MIAISMDCFFKIQYEVVEAILFLRLKFEGLIQLFVGLFLSVKRNAF